MIYMTKHTVPTTELQDVVHDRFNHRHPTKPEGDVTTFYVPPHPTQPFFLLHQQYLYTTTQAMEREIGRPTTWRETSHNWHAYELSFWMGFVLVNGALLVAYPLKEGMKPRHRVFLTRSSTSEPLISITDNPYFRRFEKYEWQEIPNLAGLPAYVRPPECLDPDAVKKMWDSGVIAV